MRIILILASIFLTLHAIIMGRVFVDMVIFNIIFIIINIVYSIPLVYKKLKVNLNPIEERIYLREFGNVMDRYTFRKLIRKAKLVIKKKDEHVVKLNDKFDCLYYVALLNPSYTVDYYKEGEKIFSVKENSWIGVIEFSMHKKEEKKIELGIDDITPVTWGVSAKVNPTHQNIPMCEDIYNQYDEACYVYEFSLKVSGVYLNEGLGSFIW